MGASGVDDDGSLERVVEPGGGGTVEDVLDLLGQHLLVVIGESEVFVGHVSGHRYALVEGLGVALAQQIEQLQQR